MFPDRSCNTECLNGIEPARYGTAQCDDSWDDQLSCFLGLIMALILYIPLFILHESSHRNTAYHNATKVHLSFYLIGAKTDEEMKIKRVPWDRCSSLPKRTSCLTCHHSPDTFCCTSTADCPENKYWVCQTFNFIRCTCHLEQFTCWRTVM